uniref:(California timema) hypothetical protein n=1 Tax=Timema californicum TaxID=61474 RepID=A0A7R9P5H6_TIMCA|nr:unnamed protein product [Timema californicum]
MSFAIFSYSGLLRTPKQHLTDNCIHKVFRQPYPQGVQTPVSTRCSDNRIHKVFRQPYHEKKDNTDSPYTEGKRTYAEKRGMTWVPPNKRPNKLKESIKELEEQLVQQKVVFCRWQDNCILQIMLGSGLLVNICVNVFTGDVVKIVFDKYLVGKLLSDYVTDVVLTRTHLICSYNDNQLTMVYFSKPTMKVNSPEKLSRLEARVQLLELAGPSGRRLERKLSCNLSGDMVLVWWRCTRDEVYPWSPVVKDQDRANVHVYSVSGAKTRLVCWIEMVLCFSTKDRDGTTLLILFQHQAQRRYYLVDTVSAPSTETHQAQRRYYLVDTVSAPRQGWCATTGQSLIQFVCPSVTSRPMSSTPSNRKYLGRSTVLCSVRLESIYSYPRHENNYLEAYGAILDFTPHSSSRTNPRAVLGFSICVSLMTGEVTVESCTYEISKCRLQRTSVTSIPLQTQVCCHAFSPDEEKLLLGCIDGSLVLFDEGRGITHLVKAAFIPTMVSWHPDGALVMVANERSQLQCFDIALSCIKNQLVSEDVTPSNLLDLASYFRNQPTLLHLEWGKKLQVSQFAERYLQTDGLLLLHFERGPLAMLRLVGGGGLQGDVQGSGLTPDALVSQYLSLNHVDRAINILLSLRWDSYGATCLACLQRITNHLFRQPLTPEREGQFQSCSAVSLYIDIELCDVKPVAVPYFRIIEPTVCSATVLAIAVCSTVQLQTALGSFHVPLQPISHATEVDFGDQVRDLTRRFFHHLLRHRLFEKAFRLAIDLSDHELFMDIHYYARDMKEHDLALAAKEKAQNILSQCSSASSCETGSPHCSHSSCSGCSTDGSSSDEPAPLPPPPLPVTRQEHPPPPPLPLIRPPPPPQPDVTRHYKTPATTRPDHLPLPITRQQHGQTKQSGERQKVKFSDTVTHILVPDLSPSLPDEEPSSQGPGGSVDPDRDKRRGVFIPDPQQELADSLPLCLGNKDYLRDFATAPVSIKYAANQPLTHTPTSQPARSPVKTDNTSVQLRVSDDNGRGNSGLSSLGYISL